jgi:hypothetical protein
MKCQYRLFQFNAIQEAVRCSEPALCRRVSLRRHPRAEVPSALGEWRQATGESSPVSVRVARRALARAPGKCHRRVSQPRELALPLGEPGGGFRFVLQTAVRIVGAQSAIKKLTHTWMVCASNLAANFPSDNQN